MSEALPTGSAFHGRVLKVQNLFSFTALAILIGCLTALLEMTRAQWWWLLGAAAIYTVVILWPQIAYDRYRMRDLIAYLDLRAAGGSVPHQASRAAYSNVSRLPRNAAVLGFFGWFVPVTLITLLMELRWSQWGVYEHLVLVMAGTQAGIVASVFLQFAVKRLAEPVRTALADDLPDPAERAELIVPNTMREKLLWCVTFTATVPVVFAALLFHAQTLRATEEFVVGLERELLSSVIAGADPEEALRALSLGVPGLAEALRVGSVEALDPASTGLDEDVLADVSRQVEEGVERGDSVGLPSARHFAWRRAEDGTIWMASLPMETVAADGTRLWTIFLLLLLGAGGVAWGLAYLLAHDVSRATRRLCEAADRFALGDLRRVEVFESEDELGDLSRAFDRMAGSLRSTIGGVAKAADRVEATAAEMATVASNVFSVTADQVAGIQHTSRSMEMINAQVHEIAESAQRLNASVEESSSSILEVGASGDELNETAGVMSDRANEVSSSIAEMVVSVKQVIENTETLSAAAVETSSSMGEMATSMREVDASAEETARLSREMVESAEQGQTKMVQTIQGMDAIREATETAEAVIRSLGGRASEIGAIVDVIDDVADETSLLALNAAIIAAQAGEHGKAFSVVADEIKDLAERVLSSTKEIGAQIRAVQDESSRAISAIEKGSAIVADGVDVTAEAGSSLEEITRASRESGERISRILTAVREQARAASHVVDLMERVRTGVEVIRGAASEQDRGNEVVHRGSVAMRDVAAQVRATTEEQARGSGRIRESVEGVRDAVEQIHVALQEQSSSCRSAAEFLDVMHTRTRSNEESASRLDEVVRELARQAESLREDVGRFRIS